MPQNKKNLIIGYIILFIAIVIPLAVFLGPIVFVGYAVGLLITFSNRKKGTPKTVDRMRQDEELITIIQPTINQKNGG